MGICESISQSSFICSADTNKLGEAVGRCGAGPARGFSEAPSQPGCSPLVLGRGCRGWDSCPYSRSPPVLPQLKPLPRRASSRHTSTWLFAAACSCCEWIKARGAQASGFGVLVLRCRTGAALLPFEGVSVC